MKKFSSWLIDQFKKSEEIPFLLFLQSKHALEKEAELQGKKCFIIIFNIWIKSIVLFCTFYVNKNLKNYYFMSNIMRSAIFRSCAANFSHFRSSFLVWISRSLLVCYCLTRYTDFDERNGAFFSSENDTDDFFFFF